jgi:pimeloyl-ACP methyl ester carboxylesterase
MSLGRRLVGRYQRWWTLVRVVAIVAALGMAVPSQMMVGAQAAPRPRVVIFLGGVNTNGNDGIFDPLQATLMATGAGDGWADPTRTTFHRFSYAWPAPTYVCRDTWTSSLMEQANRLDRQIVALVQDRPNADVMLIGHSQGGVVGLVYLAQLKGGLTTPWREVAPGSGARIAGLVTLSAPLGGIPTLFSSITDVTAQVGDDGSCDEPVASPPNMADLRRIWFSAGNDQPRGAFASVAQTLMPDRYGAGDGVRYTNQQLAFDAGFASMRILSIGNLADWVWSPCGPFTRGIPSFLDTQWLIDMPESRVYSRVFTPASAVPCSTLMDLPANHSATLADPLVHLAVASFLRGEPPDQLAPASR